MNENSNQNSSVYDLPRNMSFVASRFFGNFTNNATLYPLTDLSTIMPEFYALYSKASDRWKVFDVEEKTDYVMLVILIGWEGNSESQEVEEKVILDELKEKLHYFFDELDNDVSDKWMMAWQVLSDQEAREITKLGLINLALKAYVNSYPEADFDTIFSYGISLYYEDNTPLSSIPFLEKLRLYKLRENLKSIDLKKIEHLKNEPLQLLKEVFSYNKHSFPQMDFWEALPELTISEQSLRSLDEAALLWNLLQSQQSLKVSEDDSNSFTMSEIRQHYLDALIPVYQKQQFIDKLFKSTANNQSTAIYFDGFVLRNAQGQTFDDLINRSELAEIAEYDALAPAQKRIYLREAFAQMCESTQYKIGSLAHSLASCLIRIFQYQHYRHPPLFSDEQQLIQLFKETEEEWVEKKNYPIHPRILAALHLAYSNNVTIAGEGWQQKIKFLINCFAEEFNKVMVAGNIEQLIPSFDPRTAAREALKEYGLTDEEIDRSRPPYRLNIPNSAIVGGKIINIPIPLRSDNAIDEFLKKAAVNKLLPVSNWMMVKKTVIEPYAELKKKKEAFEKRILNDPWVTEKVRVSLESQGVEMASIRFEQEVREYADNYKKATADKQQWTDTIKTWISFVPVIGSLEMIYEGIRDKDWKTILLGSVFLTLDVWSVGLFDAVRSVPLAIARFSARERMTANSLGIFLKTLGLPFKELAQEAPIFMNSFANQVEYPALVERMRHGAQNELWRDQEGKEYLLVYLTDEDRVVPVKNQGGYYRELDWNTGEIDLKKPLIYKDKETGQYTVSALKGGGLDQHDFYIEPIPLSELKNRPTVIEVLDALMEADDFTNYSNVMENFRRFFTLVGETENSAKVEEMFQQVSSRSPTFRRLFNKFVELSDSKKDTWRINIKSGQKCQTDIVKRIIYLDPNVERSTLKYVSTNYRYEADYAGEAFNAKRTTIHELIHVFTDMDDLESSTISGTRRGSLVDKSHRGGIVYLTDKILFEAYKPIPSRLAYRTFTPGQDYISKETLLARLVQENHFLDKIVDADVPVKEYMSAAEETWMERFTIKEIKKLNLFSTPGIGYDDFSLPFLKLFDSEDEKLFTELNLFYSTLYKKSRTFRRLFDRYATLAKKTDVVEFREIKRDARAAIIPPQEGAIHFVEDNTLYWSSRGPIPIERKRRFLDKLLELFTGLKPEDIPIEKQFTDRGPLAQLADRIFSEAGMQESFSKRLVAASILPDKGEELNQLFGNWDRLSRIADLEDRILAKKVYTKRASICTYFACTSIKEKRADIKNINQTIQEIREENQLRGINVEEFDKNPMIKTSNFSKKIGFFTAKNFTRLVMGGGLATNLTATSRQE